MLWKQGTLQCHTRTPYCEGHSKARPGTDLTPLDLMAFTRNNLQRKRSSQRGIMYYVHTDSGLGFTQQGWMPTPGSLGDTDQSQRLLLSNFKGRTHSYRMKGRRRVWSCSLHVKVNSEKPLPAHCSSPSRPISDREQQALLSPQGKGMLTPGGALLPQSWAGGGGTLLCRFIMDFSKVLGGALWWLHRMATALLARL